MTEFVATTNSTVAARARRLVRPGWYARTNAELGLTTADAAAHFEAFGLREGRSPCSLFDPDWYAARAGDLAACASAIEHYLGIGAAFGHDPSPAFDSAWYVAQLSEPLPDGITPLEHFVETGAALDLDPHPLFKSRWYRATYSELDLSGTSAYEHYLDIGWQEGRDASPLFATNGYFRLNPDVGFTNPLLHYVHFGMLENRPIATVFDSNTLLRSTQFDTATQLQRADRLRDRVRRLFRSGWYITINPGIAEGAHSPADHFERFGYADHLDINVLFDSKWYRKNLPDLSPDVSALEHYLLVGASNMMSPCSMFDVSWYMRQVGGDLPPDCTPLEHYLQIGWAIGLDPHPLFSGAWYIERNAPLDLAGLTPFEHFLQRGCSDGLEPGPLLNRASYVRLNDDADVDTQEQTWFEQYVNGIADKDLVSSALFDDDWYRRQAADDPLIQRFSPLAHYLHFGGPIGRMSSPDPMAAALAKHRLSADQRSRASLVGSVRIDEVGIETAVTLIDWDARILRLDVPLSPDPTVSVVIPTFNHFEDVVRCLESIADANDMTPIEVIVVDDASNDAEGARLRTLRGVRLVRLDFNVGFADACTAGIAHARGTHLMLLNNDTEVIHGWIDSLVAELDTNPNTAIVGSMIVRPDLTLQEAGCVMWADGQAHQYGSGKNPVDFRYRYRREVDYCSGASLLIRRSMWDRIGGFDSRFNPAYYEDADICFAARNAGSNVVYEPLSVIFHNEGSTHGTDGSGTKKYQFRNKELFREKWELALMGHGYAKDAADGVALVRLRDRRRENHVVVVDHRVPASDQDAGSLRMYRLIEILIQLGHVVHFLPADGARHQPYTGQLEALGVEFMTDDVPDLIQHLRAMSSMTDFVIVSRPEVFAQQLSFLFEALPNVPIVFDMVDAHAQRIRRNAAMTARPELESEALRLERLETAASRVSDVVVVVSQADDDFITSLARVPLRTVCIPTIHYAEDPGPGYDQRDGLLFVGGFEHPPNLDAALFLVHDILPLVREQLGDIHLTIAGSKPPPDLVRMAIKNVTVTGWVPTLRPLYDRTRVVVAPLRFGAGVKGKIGEALSFGVPTVTTTIGIEGIDARPGSDILVADDARSLASRIVELHSDRALWESIRINGANSIERQFGREATTVQVKALLNAAAEVDRRPDHTRQRAG